MNSREIQDWLLAQIAEQLQVDPGSIDIREPFSNYGLSSRDLVSLSGELEDLLERRLSPTLAYEYPSIWALSTYLAETGTEPSRPESTPKPLSREPIAIIGMGCRFPGAPDINAYWQLLFNGVDAISEIPADRWPKQAFYHPDPATPGKSVSKWGGFLEHIDQFDPFFFGISPKEAKYMDPQQRLLMELSFEALDHASLNKAQVEGTQTGVFIGISVNEYSHLQLSDPKAINSLSGAGSALSIAANRISYFYNFHGPSMAIDTACSSSLSAVHLACQSLRNGECTLALAGGVNLILSPAHSIAFTKAGVLAPDGRCKTFDAAANGYVRGEGGGMIVLKPLSAALADGDPVLAVIAGSAMVQDGRTNGLMAPNQESQEMLLREAYRNAGISPGKVQYVEAHGTGTLLGDSMEAGALGAVIGAAHTDDFCAIGSVKTNIGHLEAAAGMAGLIKVVLAMNHRTLPPSLHFQTPNPHIPFEALHLKVQNERAPWPSGPAIAGLSSFGFGGTNVHVVLCEAVQDPIKTESASNLSEAESCALLPLSANSPENLRLIAGSVQELLAGHFEFTANELAHAVCKRRSQFDYRLATIGHSRMEWSNALRHFIEGTDAPGLLIGDRIPDHPPKLAFVFSGQGGQWVGMGCSLLRQEPVFAQKIEHIDRIIQEQYGWSLKEALLAAPEALRLEDISVIQPAIFAIQVGLAALWKAWGIQPDTVIGHSMGEVAAAHVAGILSLEEAIQVICLRSQRLMDLRGQGRMLATELSAEQAETWLQGFEQAVSIAAINGPTSTVLSGDPDTLQTIFESLEQAHLFCRWVKVDVASHSPQMETLRPELIPLLKGLRPQAPRIPIYSTVTGARADDLVFDANYWVDNLRKPVLFSAAIGQMLKDGYTQWIEIGPHPILLGSIQQILQTTQTPPTLQTPQTPPTLLPSIRRDAPERETLLNTLGALYTAGFSIAWENLYPIRGKQVPLPPIPWQRQRYWMDPVPSRSNQGWQTTREEGQPAHPLLGARIELAHSAETYVWQQELDTESLRYLEDHRIAGDIVLPAAAYIEMAWQAAKEAGLSASHSLADFAFLQRLVLKQGKPRLIQVLLTPDQEGRFSFGVFSRSHSKAAWNHHASTTFLPHPVKETDSGTLPDKQGSFQPPNGPELPLNLFYASLQERGLQYGPDFQGIEHLWRKDPGAVGLIRMPASLEYESEDYQVHPALLDACLQVLAAIPIAVSGQDLYLPSGCKSVRLFARPSGPIWAEVSLAAHADTGADSLLADIRLWDENHQIVAELLGFRLQRIGKRKQGANTPQDTWLYRLQWQARSAGGTEGDLKSEARNWLVFADDTGVGETLARELEAGGDRCFLLTVNEATGTEELIKTIAHTLGNIPAPLYGIVHLWSLSIPPQSSDNTTMMDALGCNSVLYLVQALASRFAGSPRLWLVTRGAQAVRPTEPIAVEQSALWGLGKVISFEFPELKCVRLDLDSRSTPAESSTLLVRQISIDDREDQVAFRGGDRFVLRLLPYTPASAFSNLEGMIRPNNTYLITGGLGGLGLCTAKWMVQQGARHLVLLGRSAASPLANQMIGQFRDAGVEVRIIAADVSKPLQMRAVFEQIKKEMPALRGLVHAAGLLDDGSLLNLDAHRMKQVMAPKVEGTWNLHEASIGLDLDFFVLFSSTVSVLGSPGQGNYTAASAYLDGMAHYRRHLGLPGISINWGPWAEVGLAVEAKEKLEEQNASTQHLVKLIEIDRGLEVFELLLADPMPQVAVLPFDLKDLLALYPTAAAMPFFAAVGGSETHVARLYARPNLRQEFVAPRNEVERKLTEWWQQTLHIDRVGIHDSFFELGGDSVLAAQILALARKAYGISINPQDAFQAFTIERLAALLEAEILKQIEEMSEEEAQQRLSGNH